MALGDVVNYILGERPDQPTTYRPSDGETILITAIGFRTLSGLSSRGVRLTLSMGTEYQADSRIRFISRDAYDTKILIDHNNYLFHSGGGDIGNDRYIICGIIVQEV